MLDQIFISYRRDDAAYVTCHINDLLRREFGNASVFTDVDNIALGVDFRTVLDETVSQCQVFLAVIGDEWLTIRDQEGELRLQDPADFVRIEIESALKRNIPIIPLLVAGTRMPAAEELPGSLKDLAFRNGIQIRPAPDFGADMDRLIRHLRRLLDSVRTDAGEPRESGSAAGAGQPSELQQEDSGGSQREMETDGSEIPEVRVQVGREEIRRKQAELGIANTKPNKRWGTRFSLIVVLIMAVATWYYASRNPDRVQAVLTAIQAPASDAGQETDTDNGAERAGRSDVDPAASLSIVGTHAPVDDADVDREAAVSVGSDAAAAAEPEPAAGVEAETVDDTTAELVADSGAAAEVTVDADTMNAAGDDAGVSAAEGVEPPELAEGTETAVESASEDVIDDEIVLTPGTQREADASGFIGEGVRLAAIGDHKAAIENFSKAIELDINAAFVYKQRAASYQAIGQREAAILDYDEAIKLNAEDVNAYYNRAASYHALQNYASAVADYDVVIQLDPEFVDAYSKRANAYEAMGDTEAALRDRATVTVFESKQDDNR